MPGNDLVQINSCQNLCYSTTFEEETEDPSVAQLDCVSSKLTSKFGDFFFFFFLGGGGEWGLEE